VFPACQLLGPDLIHVQTSAPSALAARLPPNSPTNPTFALRRGLPVTRPVEHARRRADLECRSIISHAARQSRRSACKSPSDRSLRGESRRSDGKATTLRSSCSDLAVFRDYHCACVWDVHASLGLCRSLLPLAFDLDKSRDKVGARRMREQVATAHPASSWHWSRINMGLMCAQKFLAKSGIFGWLTRVQMLARDSRHRTPSAGRFATAGEPTSCTFLMPCIRDAVGAPFLLLFCCFAVFLVACCLLLACK